jgi:VWFA-related protein
MRLGRCAAALLWAGLAGAAVAQDDVRQVERLHIDDVHPGVGGERTVELYLRALTRFGTPVRRLGPDSIELWEDDELIASDALALERFEATGRGVAAVLAIDASGTMRGDPFERARSAALAFLDRLTPADRVAVVSFAEDVDVIADFQMQRAETRAALSALEIDLERSQHTLLYDGVYRAADLIRTTPLLPRRTFIIVFSDGKDGGSDRSRENVIEACAGRGDLPQVLIFAIGYARFGGEGLQEMERLAQGTGGEFLEAASMVYLQDFFDGIATQIVNSYVLRFESSMDGAEHELRVSADKVSASRRARYPKISGPLWPWFAGAGALAAALAALRLIRSAGTRGRLAVVSGPASGTVFAVRAGKTRIGSLPDNDVTLSGSSVSRYHAEIVANGRRLTICDLGSRNGTRVNGRLVRESPLEPGDRIAIADIELVYER